MNERDMKRRVKGELKKFGIINAKDAGAEGLGAAGWYYMPGQNGMGVRTIPDFVGHYKGFFWAVETKATGKAPTGYQALQIGCLRRTGGAVFIVNSDKSLSCFLSFLERIRGNLYNR